MIEIIIVSIIILILMLITISARMFAILASILMLLNVELIYKYLSDINNLPDMSSNAIDDGHFANDSVVRFDNMSNITGGRKMSLLKRFTFNIDNGHELDTVKCSHIDPEIFEYFMSKKKIYDVSHLRCNTEVCDHNNMKIKIDKDLPREKYYIRDNEFKRSLHWGQLKLLLVEIEFLTLAYQQYKESADIRDIYFVYPGAAPGLHIPYLLKLFPMIHFELYDPRDFDAKFFVKHEMIKTYKQYFTDQDAHEWREQTKSKYVIFYSDIRNPSPSEESIMADMDMQMGWYKIINPELSMFKFKLPWVSGDTEYVDGDIYIQPFPPTESTETRLIAKKNAGFVKYNNRSYEEQMFYHNKYNRNMYFNCYLGDLILERDGIDNCYDCVRFIGIVDNYLKQMTGKSPKEQVLSLIAEIQHSIVKNSSILTHTISQQNNTIEGMYRYCYKPCGKAVCRYCLPAGTTLEKYYRTLRSSMFIN